uniref:AAA_8 domain-containing protein n=1 Tax=Rhabditophanes sp. KR3021 TaxID=114890 RepID=A0AC35TXC7_9BILA
MVFGSEKKQRLAEEKRELMNNINAEKTKAKLEEARDDLIDKIEEIETLQRKNEELIIENRNLRERIKQMEEEKRCEALLKARNLKIRDRTISISITGDRGKGKSRVGLCIGLVKDTNSPLNFSVVALFDEKDSCENLLQIVPSIFRELTMIETLNVAGNEFQVVFYAVVDFMFLSALSGHQDPVCTHSCLRCTIRMRNVKCKDYFNLVSTSRVRGEASDELSKVSQDFLKIVLPENILIAPLHLSMRVFALIREVLVNNLTDEEKQVLEDNFFDLSTPVALYWQIS